MNTKHRLLAMLVSVLPVVVWVAHERRSPGFDRDQPAARALPATSGEPRRCALHPAGGHGPRIAERLTASQPGGVDTAGLVAALHGLFADCS